MPTGYTAKLMDEGQSFQDFVMMCARAMGACVTMRDDPMDAPIPDRFEPYDYHIKCIAEWKIELARLEAMAEAERIEFGAFAKQQAITSNGKWLAKEIEQNKRLQEMEVKVLAWKTPTKDHEGLKDFMLQQITVSKNPLDYIHTLISEAHRKSPLDFYNEAVAEAKRSIEYNTKEHSMEVERATSRTKWVRQLRESINQ